MERKGPCLIIEKGEPYESGYRIQLPSKEILIGRSWGPYKPDLPFTSLYISKKHALLYYRNGQIILRDLASKHGTQVNGCILEPDFPYALRNGDEISLARGEAILRVDNFGDAESGETVDFDNFSSAIAETTSCTLVINLERREILLDGQQLYLFGKDLELLLLLYRNKNKAVSYNDIRFNVWPERPLTNNVPDVGNDEINALVYRLRKRLGKYGQRIITIPRYGYMLDL
ncbi:MAG: FHA domain-containing protein [Bacillota bacterium]|jgi:pSer/pThr/pTyr-binding forkhead associated (FHA) protein|nr:FHA domain-containing protein [Bacillota bacterium]